MKHTPHFEVAVVAIVSLTALGGVPPNLSWNTIDGGGVMRSIDDDDDGDFVLSGTIGQPDAGRMTGGAFELTGGFWFETPPGDCNASGVVDLCDHAAFIGCLTGPDGEALVADECRCFDVDGSRTVDLADFAQVATQLSAR